MSPKDWTSVPIEPGRYSNREPLTGFKRADGLGGNVLHPTCGGDTDFEDELHKVHKAFHERYPGTRIRRYTLRMPYWHRASTSAGRDQRAPTPGDYVFVEAPQPLTTTSITVAMVPQRAIRAASMGFHYRGDTLPTLRERMSGARLDGIAGNLGYYMTAGLIGHKFPWSHNRRFPQFPLPEMLSYIGFHLSQEPAGQIRASFQGAHPAAVGIRQDGRVDILPRLDIKSYRVTLAGQEFTVDAIDDMRTPLREVIVFTPACSTAETEALIDEFVASGGQSTRWQTYAPRIPLDDPERINVFVTNTGNGQEPVERIAAVWEGAAPHPSFGSVLSFGRDHFTSRFGSASSFADKHLGEPVETVSARLLRRHRYSNVAGTERARKRRLANR
jgi:hypothetical protein